MPCRMMRGETPRGIQVTKAAEISMQPQSVPAATMAASWREAFWFTKSAPAHEVRAVNQCHRGVRHSG